MDRDLQVMMTRVARLGEMSEAEARRIMNEVYQDGIVSRGEAEALFRLNDTLANSDPLWTSRFIEAVKDYLVTREPPEGWVTEDEADWLIAQVDHSGGAQSLDEIDLLLAVLRHADGAHEHLSRYTLGAISQHIKSVGYADDEMVERMRFALYASSGDGGVWVTRHEATILFETNDAVAFARNAASWNDLFARAVGNHLMARAHPNPQSEADALSREAWLNDTSVGSGGFMSRMAGSFGKGWFAKVAYDPRKAQRAQVLANEAALREAEKVTTAENDWFLERLGMDNKVSPAERSLVAFLKAEVPGFTAGIAAAA